MFFAKFIPSRRKILTVALVFATLSTVHATFRVLTREDTLDAARERLAQAQKERDLLLETKKWMDSPEYVEREVRDKLGLAREGEVIVVLPDEHVLRKLAPREEPEFSLEETLPIWRQWMRLFLPEVEKLIG